MLSRSTILRTVSRFLRAAERVLCARFTIFFFCLPRIFPSAVTLTIVNNLTRCATNHGGGGGATSFAHETIINRRTVERIMSRRRRRRDVREKRFRRRPPPRAARAAPLCARPSALHLYEYSVATVLRFDGFFFCFFCYGARPINFESITRVFISTIRAVDIYVQYKHASSATVCVFFFFFLPGQNESGGRKIVYL